MFYSMIIAIREFSQTVIGCVFRYTGFSESEVLVSNKEECVDARYIFIHILSQWLTDSQISSATGLSRTCANKIRNGFDCKYKLKFSIRLALQDIMSDLEQDDMFKRYIL